jgi:hypothetical protein
MAGIEEKSLYQNSLMSMHDGSFDSLTCPHRPLNPVSLKTLGAYLSPQLAPGGTLSQ